MVVGLFVYQQLFGFQIKFSDSPTSCPSRLLFATWPSSLSSCRLNALDAFIRPHRSHSVEWENWLSCCRATSSMIALYFKRSRVRCLTIPVPMKRCREMTLDNNRWATEAYLNRQLKFYKEQKIVRD